MVQIKFITNGATTSGAFGPGDIMRCDDDLADHLVNEAKCAEYVEAKPIESSNTVRSKVKVIRKRKDD